MYLILKNDGYISGVVRGVSPDRSNATEAEYLEIKNIIENIPAAPEGYGYRLKENLEWELYELPESPEMQEEATEADYLEELARLGVDVNA